MGRCRHKSFKRMVMFRIRFKNNIYIIGNYMFASPKVVQYLIKSIPKRNGISAIGDGYFPHSLFGYTVVKCVSWHDMISKRNMVVERKRG